MPLMPTYQAEYNLVVAGVAPGKKVVGIVGIGILELVANPVLRSLGMYGADHPAGVAVTVIVEVVYEVYSEPSLKQAPDPQALLHL
jgi:hypothetical protein